MRCPNSQTKAATPKARSKHLGQGLVPGWVQPWGRAQGQAGWGGHHHCLYRTPGPWRGGHRRPGLGSLSCWNPLYATQALHSRSVFQLICLNSVTSNGSVSFSQPQLEYFEYVCLGNVNHLIGISYVQVDLYLKRLASYKLEGGSGSTTCNSACYITTPLEDPIT